MNETEGSMRFLLLGSGEFEPWSEQVERAALALAADAGAGDGSVAIVPTASSTEGEVFDDWGRKGVAHFASLGIPARVINLRTRQDATRPELIAQLDGASMVFFSGGRPGHLSRVLVGSPFLAALLERLGSGVVYAGCSAGAIVVGARPLKARRLDPFGAGLGLVTGVVFGVHWDAIPRWMMGVKPLLRSRAPRSAWLCGIDEDTAILGDGAMWKVFGASAVHVSKGPVRESFAAPQAFSTRE